jgi:hypothetical protein
MAIRKNISNKYFTGKKCKKGHLAPRLKSDGKCLECLKIRHALYYNRNSAKMREYQRRWRKANPDSVRNYAQRRNENPIHRKKTKLRRMVRGAYLASHPGKVKNPGKVRLTLGYSLKALRVHLEGLFEEGMSHDNYGEWHIGRVKTITAYFKENNFNAKEINALSNLKPIWAAVNLGKGDYYGPNGQE